MTDTSAPPEPPMKADLAKLREELCEQPFHTVMFAREDIEELLAIAEAVERAPVGTARTDAHPWPTIDDVDLEEGQRVRLLAIGEGGTQPLPTDGSEGRE